MRVGFITGRFGHFNGGLNLDTPLGRLVKELQQKADRFTIAVNHQDSILPSFDYKIDLNESEFVPLPSMPSTSRGFFKYKAVKTQIRKLEDKSDVVIVQLPFPAPLALNHQTKPRVYEICLDSIEYFQNLPTINGFKKFCYSKAAKWITNHQRKLNQHPQTRLLTHGAAILEKINLPGNSIISSTIYENEIGSIKRTRKDSQINVLYLGFLRKEKGIDVLIDSIIEVRKQIPNLTLQIAGGSEEEGYRFLTDMTKKLDLLKQEDAIKFIGFKTFGEELFSTLSNADLLVLPTFSEGTPRVLVEARAFGCPVIASNVGGIPNSIENGVDGLLFERGNQGELSELIIKVASSKQLREKLIQNGFKTAKRFSLENFSNKIWETIVELYEKTSG